MEVSSVHVPRRPRRRTLTCALWAALLPVLVAFRPPAAGELVRPRAVAGRLCSTRPEVHCRRLDLSDAPTLPTWRVHPGTETRASWTHDGSGGVYSPLPAALPLAVARANQFLPRPFNGKFEVWIFERIPYAAKILGSSLIVSAVDAVEADVEGRVCLLAHEIHHLALAADGFGKIPPPREQAALVALLAEGAATRVCGSRDLLLQGPLPAPAGPARAFAEVRRVLRGEAGDSSGVHSLFRSGKSGAVAGTWMIREVERRFGRQVWVELLDRPPAEAGRGFLELYLSTDPPAGLRLRSSD